MDSNSGRPLPLLTRPAFEPLLKGGHSLAHALRNIWVFTKACNYQGRALAAAGGDASRLLMVDQQVVDACLSRELKQQKDPLGEVEFEAWARGRAI